MRDGSRKITHITEVQHMEGTTITTQDLFRFEQTGFDNNGKVLGHFMPTGMQPEFLEKFEISGIKLPEGFFTPDGTNEITFTGVASKRSDAKAFSSGEGVSAADG